MENENKRATYSRKKKVLIYPCGTEIGLEIYRSICNSIHYEVYGGSSSYDHGRFVFPKHIDDLPFITDKSIARDIIEFNEQIKKYEFDFIYPSMDGVLTVFSKYRNLLSPKVIGPDYETAAITRSKSETYKVLNGKIPLPTIYKTSDEIRNYPVFLKPDVGQGAKGTKIICDAHELKQIEGKTDGAIFLEYLPGKEYTVDCFTNLNGSLLYARGRERRRIKDGISVNAVFENDSRFFETAQIINMVLKQKGGWFFQVKEAEDGTLKLLEVASRIAGTSGISRNIGVNLPLLTLELFAGHNIEFVMTNDYYIEMDRALENKYKTNLKYRHVYMDYDDTLIVNGRLNLTIIRFIYQCINKGISLTLLTKHEGDLTGELKKYRIDGLFDTVVHIGQMEKKADFIDPDETILVDDSFNERRLIKEEFDIPVFDTHMIECLLED